MTQANEIINRIIDRWQALMDLKPSRDLLDAYREAKSGVVLGPLESELVDVVILLGLENILNKETKHGTTIPNNGPGNGRHTH
jgi:hypothetical protein